jgi:subtilisin family serine protease
MVVAGLTYNIHLFGSLSYNQVMAGGDKRRLDLFWSDPQSGSTNDYDVAVLDSAGNIVRFSDNLQNGTQDPYESIQTLNPSERIVVARISTSARRFLHLDIGRGYLSTSTRGRARIHATVASNTSVAATPAGLPNGLFPPNPIGPYPNPFNSTNGVELFSSDGPRRIYFRPDGTPITPGNFSSTGGSVLSKPDITAADGVSTTFPLGGLNPFFGTSAAAPHAGAIAALVKSFAPNLTSSQIITLLKPRPLT